MKKKPANETAGQYAKKWDKIVKMKLQKFVAEAGMAKHLL